MFRAPFRIAGLGDRQGVHIRAKGDAGLAIAALQDADDTGSADARMNVEPEGYQQLGDAGGCPVFAEAEFGMTVEIPPPARHLGDDGRVRE